MLVQPIQAIYFNPQTVKVCDVIIPPYDAIPKNNEAVYLKRSPYNFAHLLLPNPQDPDYTHAASILNQWKKTKVLVEDSKPSFFLYRQQFILENKTHTRDTLMCAVSLHDFADRIVRPHENTFQKYRADRSKILHQTKHQLSHIFGMVKDPASKMSELFETWAFERPFMSAKDDDAVTHTLWKVDGLREQKHIDSIFENNPIYIVDGHHRYTVNLEYAKESGALGTNRPAGQMRFCIANVFDPSLIVFPTHRMVKPNLTLAREVASILSNYNQTPITEKELKTFTEVPNGEPTFVIYHKGKLIRCTARNSKEKATQWGKSVARLAVSWSDWDVLTQLGVTDSNRSEALFYERNFEEAWKARDNYQLIIFHAPPPVECVCDVADEGKFMPQKTTYFYPKLAAGFIMRNVG